MAYPIIHNCPICQHTLHVTKLACNHCHTVIENDFSLSKFATFTKEQMDFIEVFLLKRGNIKEVEKALGISYPTVRGKLNEVISLLGHEAAAKNENNEIRKSEIIAMLDQGEITAEEAITLLKNKEE